jgi:O-antigen/teichoic acid export membrane protein
VERKLCQYFLALPRSGRAFALGFGDIWFGARHLGTEGFGALSYALAFPALFLPFASLGLDFVVVQELVRRPMDTARILGTSAIMMWGATLLSMLAAVLAWQFLADDEVSRNLIWLTVPSLFAQPWMVIDWLFQSRQASRHVVISRLVASLLGNSARIGLVLSGGGLEWFAGLVSIEAILLIVGLVIAHRRSGGALIRPWRDRSLEEAKTLLRQAWPLMFGGIFMALYLRMDQLLLVRLGGVQTLGVYAAASRLGDMAQYVTYAVILSYFPRLVSLHREGHEVFTVALRRFFSLITWLAIGVAVGVSLLAPLIVKFILGDQFNGSATVLIWLVWANVFAAQIGVRGKWLLLENRQIEAQLFFLVGAAMHLAGVYVWAADYGAHGAAISFFIAQAAMALIAPLAFRQTRSVAYAAWRSFNPRHVFS